MPRQREWIKRTFIDSDDLSTYAIKVALIMATISISIPFTFLYLSTYHLHTVFENAVVLPSIYIGSIAILVIGQLATSSSITVGGILFALLVFAHIHAMLSMSSNIRIEIACKFVQITCPLAKKTASSVASTAKIKCFIAVIAKRTREIISQTKRLLARYTHICVIDPPIFS